VEPIEELHNKLGSADEEERRLAVRELAVFPFNSVRELAFAALGDESWRVRKEAVDLLLAFSPGDELARDLINLLSVQGNAGLRNSVVEVLQTVGESVLPHLAENLGHEDPGVRKFIVDIMGGIGSAQIVPDLSAVLCDDDPNVAAAAAESLGLIGDARALPHLLACLERDDLLIRYAILEALVKIGQPVPLGKITPLAADPLLKKALFECLGIIGSPEAVPLLVDGLCDRARNVRETALVALESIRRRSSADQITSAIDPYLKAMAGTDTVEYLMSMRESHEHKIKSAAIAILGAVGDLRALDVFIREYRDENMQQIALQALRDMGGQIGAALNDRFAGADDESRCIMAHLSGELRLPESVMLAASGLGDPLPMVRALSAEAIGKSEMTELIPSLLDLLGDDQAEVRRKATGALVRLASVSREVVATAAARLAESDNPDCRLQAVRLIAALRDIGHLTFMSKDENPVVRREAVSLLGEMRAPECAGRLSIALADENLEVRLAAASALGWRGFPDESEALVLALRDPSPRVVVAALKSLGSRQQLSALADVIAIIEKSSGLILIAALQTAFQLSPKAALPYLQKAESDADDEIVRVAKNLLENMVESA